MKLNAPFIITARLLPGLKINSSKFACNDSFLSIKFDGETSDGRARYRYYLDTPGFEFTSNDLKSGVGGGSLQEGMTSLLSFLSAAAESASYYMSTKVKGDNFDLFPGQVTQWAYNHSDELSMLSLELEETADLITD